MNVKPVYYLGMDLANFQQIKILCQHININESSLQMYRTAIKQLAVDAEKECYRLLDERDE